MLTVPARAATGIEDSPIAVSSGVNWQWTDPTLLRCRHSELSELASQHLFIQLWSRPTLVAAGTPSARGGRSASLLGTATLPMRPYVVRTHSRHLLLLAPPDSPPPLLVR